MVQQTNTRKQTNAQKSLERDESLAGRTVKMTITATGKVADAYDMYVDIYVYRDHKNGEEYPSLDHQFFVRLIFWETTHKHILIGSVSVLDPRGLPDKIVKEIERISVPIEKKDYWKKMYEKALVVDISQILHHEEELKWFNSKWMRDQHEKHPDLDFADPNMNTVCVHSCPIATYETIKRNTRVTEHGVEYIHPEACALEEQGINAKCYEGAHGFVRSDSADGFELKLTSMPVSMIVK